MRSSARLSGRATRAGRLRRAVLALPRRSSRAAAVALGHPVAHGREVAHERVERADDRRRVLGADVGPDPGMAGRHPGHVAEPARGQAQQGAVRLGAVAGGVHEGRGDQVGYVRHDGDEAVVILGREHEGVGAEGDHHPLEPVERLEVGGRRSASAPRPHPRRDPGRRRADRSAPIRPSGARR